MSPFKLSLHKSRAICLLNERRLATIRSAPLIIFLVSPTGTVCVCVCVRVFQLLVPSNLVTDRISFHVPIATGVPSYDNGPSVNCPTCQFWNEYIAFAMHWTSHMTIVIQASPRA